MISAARFLVVSAVLFAGCHTAKKVAVTSFHVIDAPAKYIREHIDEPDGQTTTTTTTTTTEGNVSDVAVPGRPVNPSLENGSSSIPSQRHVATEHRGAPSSTSTTAPRTHSEVATAARRSSASSPSPRPATAQTTQFPTAKPVPGKPGYVYSVDPKGGIVDVTGYKPGDKAKDPYTQQIFIVP